MRSLSLNGFILNALVVGTLFISLLFANTESVDSFSQFNLSNSQEVVVEHLRLKVTKEYRLKWLSAEKKSWEPWLSKKKGFLGRNLFWDPENEEATLLISWSSIENWKSISEEEIASVQEEFEKIARDVTGQDLGNPFPLVFEGELLPQ